MENAHMATSHPRVVVLFNSFSSLMQNALLAPTRPPVTTFLFKSDEEYVIGLLFNFQYAFLNTLVAVSK